MLNLYRLEDIQPSDCDSVGEQGFHMAQLARSGVAVVPSLVISVQAFQAFLGQINWLEPLFADLPDSSLYLNQQNPCQLQAIARQIRSELLTATLPNELVSEIVAAVSPWQVPALTLQPYVTIQGNSTLSSQLSELLDPQICWVDPAAITQGLQAAWGEVFRARSMLLWQGHGIQLQHLRMTIVVQPLDSALGSGTAQTDGTDITVQAFRGVALRSCYGMLVPDTYRLRCYSGELVEQIITKKSICCTPTLPTRRQAADETYPLPMGVHEALPYRLEADDQQLHPVLRVDQLQSLAELVRQVQPLLGSKFRIGWIFANHAQHLGTTLKLSSVQIIQHSPPSQLAQAATLTSPATTPLPLVKGLPASRGQVIGTVYIVSAAQARPHRLHPGTILVTSSLSPDWLPLLEQVVGIITEQGGLTSHAAILARELGLPAIVNAAHATQRLQPGLPVLLDGDRGEVYPAQQSMVAQETRPHHDYSLSSSLGYSAPVTTVQTQLLVNLSQVQSIEVARHPGVSGVGLLRSELLALKILDYQHPRSWLRHNRQAIFVERMALAVSQIAAAFFPRPVWYRSLDLRSHEFRALVGGEEMAIEANPMLGLRGTLSYVKDPTLFTLELAALAQVQHQGYTNVHLLLPFVRTVEEFELCRQQVVSAGLTTNTPLQIWIMAEVPSVVWLLPDYARAGVQGISIGTNDLTQLVLAIDRDETLAAEGYNANHPAVLGAIAQIIHQARALHIPCSICGQAPVQYPDLIPYLVQLGISSISVEASAIEQTYQAILNAEQQLGSSCLL
ncbi:MAG: PEP-utilizing enzyme [Cyanobacteria bacterium]|nr:PEP-utilizing enzyme [Cyanobacteriota bacterium]MDW8200141.1 putative PEP-binding protein [Cyanobacteriota bacterium SKYGB_h_bin112]